MQAVAQPLHGGAGDEDAALQRIGALALELIGDGGEQPIARMHGDAAGIEDGEAARAVGRLDHAGLDAGLAHRRRLLVARHAEHRHRCAQHVGRRDAKLAGAIDDLGKHLQRHAQKLGHVGVPGALADIEQQRAAGIGGVARMHLAAGQPPQQEALDRARRQRALVGGGAAARHVLQDPGDLGAGEIGIEQQAGLVRHHLLVPGLLQVVAQACGAAVLPDDGIVHRLAGRAIPHHRRLALVGDADAGQIRGLELRLGERAAADLDGGAPDLLRVVLDPARLGKDLRQFLLRRSDRPAAGVEHDGACAGGALVDREDVLAGHFGRN